MAKHTVHRTCTLCEATCGISVDVDGREVLAIRGDRDDPFSRGHICPKAHGLIDLQRDPDRIRHPLRRTANGFEPIGWDEAIELAASELGRVRDASGADAIALYRGNPTVHDLESLIYWNVLQRTAQTSTISSSPGLTRHSSSRCSTASWRTVASSAERPPSTSRGSRQSSRWSRRTRPNA